jgi:hypothetical protein
VSTRRNQIAASAAVALALLAVACRGEPGAGEAHARLVVLERDVGGLREALSRLQRGEPIFPEEAVVVSISEELVTQFVTAQLPFVIGAGSLEVSLNRAEASFNGSPLVRLTGTIALKGHPGLAGDVKAIGALTGIKVDPVDGVLQADLAIDHVDLVRVAGLEALLTGGAEDELARTIRREVEGHLPHVQIPVRIEQSIDLPSVTEGPVRIQGATMGLSAGVVGVYASRGALWVAVRVEPGELVKTAAESGR